MNLQQRVVFPGLLAVALFSDGVGTFASDDAAAKPNQRVADQSTNSAQWVELINANGPKGIAKIGKNINLCGDVRLKPDSKDLVAVPGDGVVAALSNYDYDEAINLLSKPEFGDCEVHLEFLIGRGCNSGVKLQQRYEVQLYDSHDKEKPTARECGGIYPHWLFQGQGKPLKYIDKGVPPAVNAAKPAGEWQNLEIVFQAPRFDDQGEKTVNAKFVLVRLNDQAIHRDVELDSPTGNATSPLPEVAKGPLLLQMDHGAVAFRNVRVRPIK